MPFENFVSEPNISITMELIIFKHITISGFAILPLGATCISAVIVHVSINKYKHRRVYIYYAYLCI
jgi:hypothetical protein